MATFWWQHTSQSSYWFCCLFLQLNRNVAGISGLPVNNNSVERSLLHYQFNSNCIKKFWPVKLAHAPNHLEHQKIWLTSYLL
jgi:hypothetical protein